MNDPGTDSDAPRQLGRPQRRRRLSDMLLGVVHSACDRGDLRTAAQLLAIVEFMLQRAPPEGRRERLVDAEPFVVAHERLWLLRQPNARND